MERKRKISFNIDIESDEIFKRQKKFINNYENIYLHNEKSTLDIDEEYDNTKSMNQDEHNEIRQEQTIINFDNNNIKIPSFNMDEEMEEEQYNETRYIQWKQKDTDELHNAWLNNIAWSDIKNYELKNSQITEENFNDLSKINNNNDDEDDDIQFNEINALKSLLTIMQPNETVIHTIKRLSLASTNNKSKQRIKQRKPLLNKISTTLSVELTFDELKKNKLLLEEMTGLADQFVSNGQHDIYHETYEQLQIKLNHT